MLFQYRNTKVLVAALISIGIGAVVLKTLDSNPLPAGAFSLSEYYHLAPVEKVIPSDTYQTNLHWSCIEISYINTKATVDNKQYSRSDLFNRNIVNYHFIVWNSFVGGNGQIQSPAKWQSQSPTIPGQTWFDNEQVIYIGVVIDGKINRPTDFQIKRTEALVEALSIRFDIPSESIYYPDNWW
ncbi:MAG: hypothetical protein ACYSSL_04380 [Planctomycetota bacterium]